MENKIKVANKVKFVLQGGGLTYSHFVSKQDFLNWVAEIQKTIAEAIAKDNRVFAVYDFPYHVEACDYFEKQMRNIGVNVMFRFGGEKVFYHLFYP